MSAKTKLIIATIFAIGIAIPISAHSNEASNIDHSKGKYLIEISGCNDCHTAGYAASGATTPEAQWLSGDELGYRGPWGTTYPVNLREYFGGISENEWVTIAKALKTRPPMPWWALNVMTESDLRTMYQYIIYLGVLKKDIPLYVPPGVEPKTPYIQWPLQPE